MGSSSAGLLVVLFFAGRVRGQVLQLGSHAHILESRDGDRHLMTEEREGECACVSLVRGLDGIGRGRALNLACVCILSLRRYLDLSCLASLTLCCSSSMSVLYMHASRVRIQRVKHIITLPRETSTTVISIVMPSALL